MAGATILRIFPDGDRVEQALIETAAESGIVDATGYLSFAQLIEQCEPAQFLHRRACSPLEARVVLWSVARRLPQGPFRGFVQEPAFARAAQELFFDFKSGCSSPRELSSAAESIPGPRRERARYLASLFHAYQARMDELALADREDLLRGACEAVAHAMPPRLRGARELEVRDLYDFSPLRLRFLLALADRCRKEGIHFRLLLPGSGSPAVDGPVDDVLRELERRWETVEIDAEKTLLEDRPLSQLGARLFSAEDPIPAPSLSAFSAGTAREEARQIARGVRRLIDAGTPPEQVAVAFRDLSEEAEAVAEALDALGVPSRIRLGAPLRNSAVGRLALELPSLAEEGFPAEGVARYLESRYAPEVSRSAPLSPGAVFARAGIRDDRLGSAAGKGAYAIRLGALASRADRAHRHELSKAARAALEAATKLMELAGQIPDSAPIARALEHWWQALDGLGLEKAVRRAEPRSAEGTPLGRAVLGALARDQAAAEALRELTTELESALNLSGAGKEKVSRPAFQRWLLDSAADFNLDSKGPRTAAVRVLDVRQLAGARLSHLFVGGMADGRFPGRSKPHPLFPDEDRALVNRALGREVFRLSSGDVERLPFRLAEDRLLLHLALGAATSSVTLSFARQAGGREQLASPFFDELARVAGLEVRALPIRPVPSAEELGCEQELRARVALECLARPELRASEPDRSRFAFRRLLGGEEWFLAAQAQAAIEEERLLFFSDSSRLPGPHSGKVGEEALTSALREAFAFDQGRPASASLLQRYGNCAFQGFLTHGLGLEEPEAPGEELDSRGRGSFWHKVLEELFPSLKEAGALGKPPEEVPDELLDSALERAAADYERRGHVGHPVLWRLGRERARAMARRVLSSETRGLPFDGLTPDATELPFGRSGAKEKWREVILPPALPGESPIYLEGWIDRLDRGEALGVVDYKSGRGKTAKKQLEALLTTDYQLPLYAYAARSSGAKEVRAAWLSLRDGDHLALEKVLAAAEQSLDELLASDRETRLRLLKDGGKNLANAVHGLVASLRRGEFPARPQDCGFCPYRPVCRISERRLQEAADG